MDSLKVSRIIYRNATKATEDEFNVYIQLGQPCPLNYDERIKHHYRRLVLEEEKNIILWKEYLVPMMSKHGLMKSQDKEKLDGNWFWITLRPSDEHSDKFLEFKTIVEAIYLKRKMFIKGSFCWEQKGTTNETMGQGYHVHILCQCRDKMMKTQLIIDTKSTFRTFLGGEVPEAFIEAKYVRLEEDHFKITNYMKGIKTDESGSTIKADAIKFDSPWRQKYNLIDWNDF